MPGHGPNDGKKRSRWVDFAAVKRQVSMEQVLELYKVNDLHGEGADFKGPCPFFEHGSGTSFSVSKEKNVWFCHACERGGNVLDFVATMDGCSVREAALSLAERFEVDAKRPPQKAARRRRRGSGPAEAASEAASGRENDDSGGGKGEVPAPETVSGGNPPLSFELKLDPYHEAIADLGFSSDIARTFGGGWCSRGVMQGTVASPLHSPTGELIGYVGYDPVEQAYRFPEKLDRSREVFNIHRATNTTREVFGLIVVEHALDVWRFEGAGFLNCVALMGSTMSDRQCALIASLAGETQKVTVVMPPGERRDKILVRLAGEELYVRALWEASPLSCSPDELRSLVS